MLVDADAYFRAVRTAIRNARHSIFILSWDIDSRTRLVPQGAHDGFPEPLGDFLHEVVKARHGLRAYVLNWDFAMLYALEREWLPLYKLDWRTHRRLAFRMDAKHPLGASHHQKIVVVDDSVAFVGGLDLTRARWDTPAHAALQPLRCDTAGKPHAPFPEVQALVHGAIFTRGPRDLKSTAVFIGGSDVVVGEATRAAVATAATPVSPPPTAAVAGLAPAPGFGARLLGVSGHVQREGGEVHLVAQRLVDLSAWLGALGESGLRSRDFH